MLAGFSAAGLKESDSSLNVALSAGTLLLGMSPVVSGADPFWSKRLLWNELCRIRGKIIVGFGQFAEPGFTNYKNLV